MLRFPSPDGVVGFVVGRAQFEDLFVGPFADSKKFCEDKEAYLKQVTDTAECSIVHIRLYRKLGGLRTSRWRYIALFILLCTTHNDDYQVEDKRRKRHAGLRVCV